jgi:hypothetical protein
LHTINRRKDRKPEIPVTNGKETEKAPEGTIKERKG